jgi:hypothetical protein
MARSFLRNALVVVFALAATMSAFAQTNPTPWALSSGDYSFTTWTNTNPAMTYPQSMAFHTFSELWEPFGTAPLNLQPNGDWTAAYNLTGSSRIMGEGTNGISFTNTAAGQSSNNCSYVGAAVLALNTIGRAEINVSFTSGVLLSGTRPYVLRLQYRIGTSGAWTDLVDPDGNFVECNGLTGLPANLAVTLPTVCENQSTVQLRWLYFQIPSTAGGARPRMRLDDISVTSQPNVGTATALSIRTLSPRNPSRGVPFSVVVRAVDAFGNARTVGSNTTVTLQLNSGTGALGGTLSGVIPAGQSLIVFNNVTYNTAEAGVTIRATAGGLTTGTSTSFAVSTPGTWNWVRGFENIGYVGTPMSSFTASAIRDDNQVDAAYAATMNIVRVSGPGSLTGTTSVAAVRGVATFNNVSFSAPGTYTLRIDAPGLPSVTLPDVTVNPTPTLATNIVPQFVQGRFPSGTCNWNARPIPVYARVTFTNLTPNAIYRFNTGFATDQVLSSTGPGFNLQWNGNTHTYTYQNSKNLVVDGAYSTFSTTSTETSKSIWINLTATNGPVFEPGNTVYWRISLGDNSGRLIRHYELSQTSSVIGLGSATNQGTGIVDEYSHAAPKNYIVLWDNTAGTGRPLAIAGVQPDGAVFPSNGSESWYMNIDEDQTAWATFIPNTLANGVRRIEERSYLTGNVVNVVTSTNGIWNGVNTVNPTGGFTNPIYLRTPKIAITAPAENDTVCTGSTMTIRYIARGVAGVNLEWSSTDGLSWEPIGTVDFSIDNSGNQLTGERTFDWTVRGANLNPNYRIRVTATDRSDITATTPRFVVAAPIAVLQEPQSKDLCLDENYEMIVLTSGSVRSYQWYKDGEPISGATSAIFAISDAHFGTSGVYTCLLSGYGSCGDVWTQPASIRVSRPTKIVNQTLRVPVELGATATLTVEAELPHEATYQWYRGQNPLVEGDRIFGATSNRLEIRGVTRQDLGNDYWCQVSGVCGTVASRVVRVYSTGVFADPIDANVAGCAGATAVLRVDAYANPASTELELRWMRNGQPIVDGGKYSGATTSALTISNVSPAEAGMYELHVTVVGNPAQSAHAEVTLSIASAPSIATQPSNVDLCEGQTLTLTVGATAQGTIEYQWLKDGVAIGGATNSNYIVPNFTAARAGTYTCRVSTACGTVLSNAASVTAKAATTITAQPPATLDVQIGSALTINLTATGAGTLQYQWYKDGTELTGEVAPTYTKTSAEASDAGQYWCRVRSECGDLMSDTTTVTTRPVVSSVNDEILPGGCIVRGMVPNPASSMSTIAITVPAPVRATIHVTDVTGKTVATLVDADVMPGMHEFMLDASGLSNGTYLVTTILGNERTSQTISIVK